MLKIHRKSIGLGVGSNAGAKVRALAAFHRKVIRAVVKRLGATARASPKGLDVSTQSHPLAPRELAGKWVAWSGDNREIVAYGDTLAEVRDRVAHSGAGRVSYEKLRPLSCGLAPQSRGCDSSTPPIR